MKKLYIYSIILLLSMLGNAQVLFTENFNSYSVGLVSNDITGIQPGVGGWYIDAQEENNFNPPSTPADYQIKAEGGRGNIFYSPPANPSNKYRRLFRNDIKTYWQQRTPGNNVLKISFDVFNTGSDPIAVGTYLFSDEGSVVGLVNFTEAGRVNCQVGRRGEFDQIKSGGGPFVKNGFTKVLPDNTWVTLEMYVDYNTSTLYYSIPMLNYTVKYNLYYTLQNNAEFDDSPTRLVIENTNMSNVRSQVVGFKYDNISISAQNTVPVVTAGLEDVLANQFTIYPNPASNLVTITNVDNLPVQQITIYDMAGKQLSTKTFNAEAEVQLNIEHLANGTYLLHIQTTQGTAVKRLIRK